jgi:23S rRNA pseudouridine2605 synthase
MLAKLGHKVMSLNRVAVGPISLKGLSVGECRRLSPYEVDQLQKVAFSVTVSGPRSPNTDPSPRSRHYGPQPTPPGRSSPTRAG